MHHPQPSTRSSGGVHPALLGVERSLSTPERLLFSSSSLDEARSRVARLMKPHRIQQLDRSERLDARLHHLALGEISISRLRYGARVEIDCDPLDGCFLIQMPMAGSTHITVAQREVDTRAGQACVLSHSDAAHMQWSHDADQLIMRVSRSLLERSLVGHLGHPLEAPLRFEHSFAWRDNTAWCCLLAYLMECAAQYPDLAQHPLVLPQIEQLTSAILLASQPHNHSTPSPSRRSTVLPRHVRRVQDFIHTHAHEAITPQTLASVAGVSLRSLYSGFRDFLQVSPMQYLRDLRMDNVRNELLSGDASNIAGVALRWGFTHLGRFSSEYKQRFGETPSQTLRRN